MMARRVWIIIHILFTKIGSTNMQYMERRRHCRHAGLQCNPTSYFTRDRKPTQASLIYRTKPKEYKQKSIGKGLKLQPIYTLCLKKTRH